MAQLKEAEKCIHIQGTQCETKKNPKRAIARGSIRVLAIIEPGLQKGSYALPKDWPHMVADEPKSRVAVGASLVN